MRHDILSRPKETENSDLYSGSIYHVEELGGAFVFVQSNCDVGWEKIQQLWHLGVLERVLFSMAAALDSGPVYTLRVGSLSIVYLHCYEWAEMRWYCHARYWFRYGTRLNREFIR